MIHICIVCHYLARTIPVRLLLIIFLFCFLPVLVISQTTQTSAASEEQQLENNAASNADTENEDDGYQQQMQYFIKHPINLNAADENDLEQLKILQPLQIQNLLKYRDVLGKLIHIYELQAVPGWDIALIKKIQPYIFVDSDLGITTTLGKRLAGGEHSLLVRMSQTVERSKGFLNDTAQTGGGYRGSPQKVWVRYKYQYKNLLQYGVAGEKDAGEQFFKGSQKQGFDFYSAHFFARNIGIIKALALGDFAVNLGQGLVQWQSLAFKKSSSVMNIKREEGVLRPYNSAGEINFRRGAGLTLAKNQWAATVFISSRKLDANFITDTSQTQQDFISSLQTSGYHRTKSETDDKGVQKQLAFGGNLSFNNGALHIGLNGIQYKFSLPLIKSGDPYNLYTFSGKSLSNYSIDYSYTFKNVHLFGEAATTKRLNKALIAGALISAAPEVDISFLYRNISKSYQSLYTNAFTENTYPVNEKGFYTGLSVRLVNIWQLNAYADFYKFPWLKFRVDAPSNGADYLIQLNYTPNKKVEVYSCFRNETKGTNSNQDQLVLGQVTPQHTQTWRTQFSSKLNSLLVLSCRFEALWLNAKTTTGEQGFLTYINFLYKSMAVPLNTNIRLQHFETNSYNSRIYAYENDVLYSFAIPVFYDKGFRYYININYDVNKKLSFWMKWDQTIYNNKTLIGSGLDEINGHKKSGIKLQVLYKF